MTDAGSNNAPTVVEGSVALTYSSAASLVSSLQPELTVTEGAIPGFVIDRVLGRGGGGCVFRAFRADSDQPLALKVLSAPLGSGPGTARVWREIDLLASLRLPCVARFIEYGTHEGRMFIVTEFVPGGTLADTAAALHHRESSPSTPLASVLSALDPKARTRELVLLLARLADAVQAIHERGVLHRDLKPSNVIVTATGDPVLVDFGLATLADQCLQTLTTEGLALGTPAFMPPEQARGDRTAISTRSDVWSLGATTLWVLTGKTAYDTDCPTLEALRRVAHDPPRGLRDLCPDLPRPLAAVIGKATSPEPAARYATAAEFAADLRRFSRGEPVTAVEPTAWLRVSRWIGRHPIASTAAACTTLGLALLGGSGALSAMIIRARMNQPANFVLVGEPDKWHQARLISRAGNDLGVVGSPENQDLVRIASLVTWPDGLSGRDPGSQVAVVAAAGRDPSAGTRGQLWVCDPSDLSSPLFTSPAAFTPPPSPDNYPDFPSEFAFLTRVIEADVYPALPGPEFIVIAELSESGTPNIVFVQDLTGRILFEAWHFGHLADAQWWPDHQLLVVTGDRHGQQTHQWAQVDHPEAQLVARLGVSYPYPRIVLGVRLDIQGKHGWLRDSRDAAPDNPTRPLAWYKALWPPRGTLMFTSEVSPATQHDHRAKMVDLHWKCTELEFPDEPRADAPLPAHLDSHAAAWKSWAPTAIRWDGRWIMRIDARGSPLGPSPDRVDGWKRSFSDGEQGAMAVESQFTLVDFPTGVPHGSGQAP